MIEPLFHSEISKTLPYRHWLFDANLGAEWACVICRYLIYRVPDPTTTEDVKTGNLMTWVETGLILGGDTETDPVAPYLLCAHCFQAHATVYPTLYDFWMLNDDGTPQAPRMTAWIGDNLVVNFTGIDLENDPPMELDGYERAPAQPQG